MNVIMIFEEINLVSEKDAEIIEKIIQKYFINSCSHFSKNKLKHNISILLLMYIILNNIDGIKFVNEYFRYNKIGLPLFPTPHSISYCTSAACCVVCEVDVGIDIQDIVELEMICLREIATKSEIKYLMDNNNDKRDIVRLFTLKECLGKYLNVGLNYPITKIRLLDEKYNFDKYGLKFESKVFEKYIISLCTARGMSFEYRQIDYGKLKDIINYFR